MTYLIENGFITPKSSVPRNNDKSPPANPPGSVASPGVSFEKIDEETYKAYLLSCMNGVGDIRICAEIRSYLEKTKALTQAATYQPRPSEEDVYEFAE